MEGDSDEKIINNLEQRLSLLQEQYTTTLETIKNIIADARELKTALDIEKQINKTNASNNLKELKDKNLLHAVYTPTITKNGRYDLFRLFMRERTIYKKSRNIKVSEFTKRVVNFIRAMGVAFSKKEVDDFYVRYGLEIKTIKNIEYIPDIDIIEVIDDCVLFEKNLILYRPFENPDRLL